jgi:hypothetical protein
MLSVDRALRELGASGFETQMFVYLSGRADVASLRVALRRMSERYPLATARLTGAGEDGEPCWRFRPGAYCPLGEADLPSAGADAVLGHAARLLSTPADPVEADPIRFVLLHRPDGRDVFLVQYNHTLMDNNGAVRLLRELGHLTGGLDAAALASPAAEQDDLLRGYLRRFPRQRRRAAALETVDLWGDSARGGVAMLGATTPGREQAGVVAIISRCLGQNETRALQARVLKACGFPSLSMELLGSAFRAVGRLSPQRWPKGYYNLVAGIGLDLGLRSERGPIFQNLTSLVPIHARSEDLKECDRDALQRMLSQQVRQRLEGGTDLGMLQLVELFSRRPRQARWVIGLWLRVGFSLWYAYFGALEVVADRFCGTDIEDLYFAGPAWSPVGVTLLANQFRGRLLLQATYVPAAVPDALAHDFLDTVVRDLVE